MVLLIKLTGSVSNDATYFVTLSTKTTQTMKLRIPIGYQVECLYTNGTCIVQDAVVRLDEAYEELSQLVKDNFGTNMFLQSSLPVTLILAKGTNGRLYYTYSNNTLSVGHFCKYPKGEQLADACKHWPTELMKSPIGDTINPRDEGYKPYHIYHCDAPSWRSTLAEQQPRTFVGIVHADSLIRAYQIAQLSNAAWAVKGFRGTQLGDIIEEDHICYMVSGYAVAESNPGFKILPDVRFTEGGHQVTEEEFARYQQQLAESFDGKEAAQ